MRGRNASVAAWTFTSASKVPSFKPAKALRDAVNE